MNEFRCTTCTKLEKKQCPYFDRSSGFQERADVSADCGLMCHSSQQFNGKISLLQDVLWELYQYFKPDTLNGKIILGIINNKIREIKVDKMCDVNNEDNHGKTY